MSGSQRYSAEAAMNGGMRSVMEQITKKNENENESWVTVVKKRHRRAAAWEEERRYQQELESAIEESLKDQQRPEPAADLKGEGTTDSHQKRRTAIKRNRAS